ncbi:MAG: hypothetical protein QXF76_00375 [Candidatus Anstonellales archaeon]
MELNKNQKMILSVFLNFFIPGSGYLVLQKRLLFGILILASQLLLLIYYFTNEEEYKKIFTDILYLLSVFIAAFAFAYDAYELAKREEETTKSADNQI